DPDRLARVIGAQGLTGTILDVTLRLHRVHGGWLRVDAVATPSLEATLEVLEEGGGGAAYAVGWVDCLSRGRSLGRGILHFAREIPADHRLAGEGLTLGTQELPERLLGLLPRRHAPRALRVFTHAAGVRALNAARWLSGRVRSGRSYIQPHAAFHFLLDYVPEWKRVYGEHGFLQYQLFVPAGAAAHAFAEALRLQRRTGVHAYLAVVKRHRAGRFAAPYALDGYSLAMDFPVRPRRLRALAALCASYDELLREVGGRIYAAKDAVGAGRLPEHRHPLFSSNLVRRWERHGGA
ncbi:MAG TPA: hypothetical protein VGB42_04520, partial [Candidatus Thermoplasmatota archaeon]